MLKVVKKVARGVVVRQVATSQRVTNGSLGAASGFANEIAKPPFQHCIPPQLTVRA
jgi:hypothetical protein